MLSNLCLIVGFGKTGKSAYNFLLKKGYMPIFYDDKEFNNYEYINTIINKICFAVVSPGVKDSHNIVKLLKENNIDVLSLTEIYYVLREYKSDCIIGVTGTNGKTTVTTMIGEILGSDAFVCGNVGVPWSEKRNSEKYSVIELSSFELNRTDKFCPNMFILLNIRLDHLDYHGSYKNYINAKLKPLKNITQNSVVIYNADDLELKKECEKLNCNVYYFSKRKKKGNGIYIDNKSNNVTFECCGNKAVLYNLSNVKYSGDHNLLNILASSLATYLLGVKSGKILDVLNMYKYCPFRFEELKTLLPYKIINDSKATNLASTISAIKSVSGFITLIVGGVGKGECYDELFEYSKKIKLMVVYGEVCKEIQASANKNNFKNYIIIKDFKTAVKYALLHTGDNETLLFSPACASFDQFSSYYERGLVFNNIVLEFEKNN